MAPNQDARVALPRFLGPAPWPTPPASPPPSTPPPSSPTAPSSPPAPTPPSSPLPPGAAHSSASPETAPSADVCALGRDLLARTAEIVARTVARNTGSGVVLGENVEQRFERVGEISTRAVASWMAGESIQEAVEIGQEVWQIFGQLAAQRAAPLAEVTKRCWRWRDSVHEALGESRERMGLSQESLIGAREMLETTLRLTLVQVCDCFDAERLKVDQELETRQQELAFMATHDALTGLPNRTLVVDRLEQTLLRARRAQTPVAALFIDIDNFKAINDTLGHEAGDELLRGVAARLDGVVRDVDALGRLAGDEFVVVAGDMSLIAGPELIAERLLDTLREPIPVGEERTAVTVTASIGIATGDRATAAELLRDADIAMYRAKWSGKNRYVVFESGMQDAVQSRMELEMDLRDALEKEEFFLVYQPTFDLRTMSPTGMEALIRWRHPVRGIVQPDDFVPLLEEIGVIAEVGKWVLREACRQGAAWRACGHTVGMAVNVSALQIDTDEFVAEIEDALASSGLEPSALTIEITETALMGNAEETAGRLEAVKRLGVRIAIDDFGTGYSSLAYLQRFPVDALKIDRSFISRLTHDEEGETLIRTLVQLGKSLSIETLAEGIEESSELSLLKEEQCDSGQGFLFARPLEVDACETFLSDWIGGKGAVARDAVTPRAQA
jgi:diguanylate cyclase (GGDEF)-like protein